MSKWKEYKLCDLADVIMGQSPPSTSYNEENVGLPFLQGCAEFGDISPVVKYYCTEPKKIAPKNSILISVRAPVGVTNLADKEFVIGRGLASIVPTNSDLKFLLYTINLNVAKLEAVSQGSTFSAINTDELNKFKINAPLIPEQRKISQILSTADSVIEKTQAAIAKYKAIKQGMLHDLFTRGIDLQTGKLRPKYEDAPELYKESRLGWIPKEWDIKEIGEVGEVRMCRRVFNHETKDRGEIPFYKIGTFGEKPDAYISKDLYERYRQSFSFPKKGDILISAAGTIGRTIIYDGSPSYFQDSNIVWIENNGTLIPNQFLYQVFKVVKYKTEGGTIQRLYNNILKSANFPCPANPEQEIITERLNAIESKLKNEENLLKKLEQIKAGLMGDLLSGSKEVKIIDKEEVLHG